MLDPEQNSTFRDTYLAVPYDLSKVMFVCTANVLDTIPGPLRDRMEVIQLPGYTAEEKLQIARRYLVPRQLAATGITAEQCEITDDALEAIIGDYTREAGVRNLEREIGGACRHVAVRIAEGSITRMTIAAADLHEILGPKRFEAEVAMRTGIPGVATGLAWTPVGGDILFIEAARTPGSGRLILTGQLGEVMKESAQAALSLVKARAALLDIPAEGFDKADIHVHVPAGATPKDGPSAGVAMFVALTSLLSHRPVKSDVAMTGEISLRGLVLPIGGVKEKVLAALRAGITTVMLPARNRRDLEDIPADAREQVRIEWLETVDDALRVAGRAAARDRPRLRGRVQRWRRGRRSLERNDDERSAHRPAGGRRRASPARRPARRAAFGPRPPRRGRRADDQRRAQERARAQRAELPCHGAQPRQVPAQHPAAVLDPARAAPPCTVLEIHPEAGTAERSCKIEVRAADAGGASRRR